MLSWIQVFKIVKLNSITLKLFDGSQVLSISHMEIVTKVFNRIQSHFKQIQVNSIQFKQIQLKSARFFWAAAL